jgi:hypothetical protein
MPTKETKRCFDQVSVIALLNKLDPDPTNARRNKIASYPIERDLKNNLLEESITTQSTSINLHIKCKDGTYQITKTHDEQNLLSHLSE